METSDIFPAFWIFLENFFTSLLSSQKGPAAWLDLQYYSVTSDRCFFRNKWKKPDLYDCRNFDVRQKRYHSQENFPCCYLIGCNSFVLRKAPPVMFPKKFSVSRKVDKERTCKHPWLLLHFKLLRLANVSIFEPFQWFGFLAQYQILITPHPSFSGRLGS